MRFLIDTHLLLWALTTPARLGPSLRDRSEDPANIVLLSAASLWEIAIKAQIRRSGLTARPDQVAQEAIARGLTEMPVRWMAAAAVTDLPLRHRDPFDRMLVAQAVTEPVHLLTADRTLLGYSDMVTLADVR